MAALKQISRYYYILFIDTYLYGTTTCGQPFFEPKHTLGDFCGGFGRGTSGIPSELDGFRLKLKINLIF